MSIYVVRHGQTDWNIQKRIQGRKDIPLNKNGLEQAEMLKKSLNGIKFSKVITSPLKRAKQTANILYSGQIIEDERMIERDFGEFEGLTKEDFDSDGFWSYRSNYTYKHAENIKDFFDRIYGFLEDLKSTSKDEDILIVTHTGNLLAINTYFNGIPEDDNLFNIDFKNCSVVKYEFDKNGYQICPLQYGSNMDKINIFDNPKKYIHDIVENIKIEKTKQKVFDGKSLASIFLTKFCDAGCKHCFFKSKKKVIRFPEEQDEFSDYGLEKFIEFINKTNNGYLLVIGGGEPFKKIEHIKEIVKRVKTDRMILVTNGMWAKSYDNAKKIIFELYECFKTRRDNTKVILRLSVDKWHLEQLGDELITNIIDIFKENFKYEENFELQFHTLIGDATIENLRKKRNDFIIEYTKENGLSDNDTILKISPNRCKLIFDNDYIIYTGISRFFFSDLRKDLTKNTKELQDAIHIFAQDMKYSAMDNPSVILNTNGELGLNFWVNYNGNVALWGNQQLYDLKNLYTDSADEIIQATFDNIITYSFVDKGYENRKKIINEVNKKAVLRSEAINIRDYAGAAILEEAKTLLYYSIRIIMQYLDDNILTEEEIKNIPEELKKAIFSGKSNLKKLYQESPYCIIDEYIEKENFVDEEWKDLFTLIKLGHYEVSQVNLQRGLDFYNKKAKLKIESIDEIEVIDEKQYERLNEKLTFMKEESKQWCTNSVIVK